MKVEIYGGNIAALVLANELIQSNNEVLLKVKGSLNTHFSGVHFAGTKVDRGMLLLEPQPAGIDNTKIELYNGEYRAAARPFVHHVFNWLLQKEIRVSEVTVKTYFRSKIYPDIFISDRLELLDDLSNHERVQIIREITLNNFTNGSSSFHPKNKNTSNWFRDNSFLTVSRNTVGDLLTHLLFEPFLFKIHGEKLKFLAAREHRSSWVPMYYPDSILNMLRGNLNEVKPTHFLYPRGSTMASFISDLVVGIAESSEIRTEHTENNSEILNSPKKMKENKIAYFGDVLRTFGSQKSEFDSSSGRLVYFECDSSTSETFFIVDSEWSAFRVTKHFLAEQASGYVCIEFGASSFLTPDAQLITEAKELCQHLGILIVNNETSVLKARYPLRNSSLNESEIKFVSSRKKMKSKGIFGYPVVDINNSFNDQVCAALGTYAQLKNL